MSRKTIALMVVLAIGITAFFYLYGGSSAPRGQAELVKLSAGNIPQLKDAFNASPSSVRVLVMLSPT